METVVFSVNGTIFWKGMKANVLTRGDRIEIAGKTHRVLISSVKKDVQKILVSSRPLNDKS